jgi:hypothetical protein
MPENKVLNMMKSGIKKHGISDRNTMIVKKSAKLSGLSALLCEKRNDHNPVK